MYINQRNKIVGILDTAMEAIRCVAEKYDDTYISIIMEGLLAVSRYMKNISNNEEAIERIESIWKLMQEMQKYAYNEESEKKIGELYNGVHEIRNCILQEKCRYKAVFMPYKASMWTSLESIWFAAQRDPDCDAVVMPLPYYDISNKENIRVIYEGNQFPSYVPITDYLQYDLAVQEPEMGFVHNPYDDTNNLTWVHPRYFSGELKKNIKCLVYSPYLTIASYTEGASDFLYTAPGIYNADKIVAQSESVSQIFQHYGHKKSKIIVQGTPKIDAVVTKQREEKKIPSEWKEKLHGKVFLLNTHLSYLPKAFTITGKQDNYATKYLREIMDTFINNQECSLIWRPHPLSRSMLESRFPECFEIMNNLEKRIYCSSNCVMDETDDYRIAFQRSDALISTYSSLINEYMATGKPVMIFQKQLSHDADMRAPLKRNLNYFRTGVEGMGFPDFIRMVTNGEDPKRKERMEMIKQAFVNSDGSAGKEIYLAVVKEMIG